MSGEAEVPTPDPLRARCDGALAAWVAAWRALDPSGDDRATDRSWARVAACLPTFLDDLERNKRLPELAATFARLRLRHHPALATRADQVAEACLRWKMTADLWDRHLALRGQGWAHQLVRRTGLSLDQAEDFVEDYVHAVSDPERRFTFLDDPEDRFGASGFAVHDLHALVAARLPSRWRDECAANAAAHAQLSALHDPVGRSAVETPWQDHPETIAQYRAALVWCVWAADQRRRQRAPLLSLLANPRGLWGDATLLNRRSEAKLDLAVRLAFAVGYREANGPGLYAAVAHHLPIELVFDPADRTELSRQTHDAESRVQAALPGLTEQLAAILPATDRALPSLSDPPAGGLGAVLVQSLHYCAGGRSRAQVLPYLEGALKLGAAVRRGPDGPAPGRGAPATATPIADELLAVTALGELALRAGPAPRPTAEQILEFVDAQSIEPRPEPALTPWAWWRVRWFAPWLVPTLATVAAALVVWQAPLLQRLRGVEPDARALSAVVLPASEQGPPDAARELRVQIPDGATVLHVHVWADGGAARRLDPIPVRAGARVVTVPGPFAPTATIALTLDPTWTPAVPCAPPTCASVRIGAP
jgi:hypothetical protein